MGVLHVLSDLAAVLNVDPEDLPGEDDPRIAPLLAELGEHASAWLDVVADAGADAAQAILDAEGRGCPPAPGCYAVWSSRTEWAEDYLDGTSFFEDAHPTLREYFDVDRWVRDVEIAGDQRFADLPNGQVVAYDIE